MEVMIVEEALDIVRDCCWADGNGVGGDAGADGDAGDASAGGDAGGGGDSKQQRLDISDIEPKKITTLINIYCSSKMTRNIMPKIINNNVMLNPRTTFDHRQ